MRHANADVFDRGSHFTPSAGNVAEQRHEPGDGCNGSRRRRDYIRLHSRPVEQDSLPANKVLPLRACVAISAVPISWYRFRRNAPNHVPGNQELAIDTFAISNLNGHYILLHHFVTTRG
jgi:hypothetical protein